MILLVGARSHNHANGKAKNSEVSNGDDSQDDQPEPILVKTIHPKRDPSFAISVNQPAYVEGYFSADLMAKVAGQVKFIAKDFGESVSKGELLMEIDAPDLILDVAQKEAVIKQRQQDVKLAEALIEVAEAEVEIGFKTIKQREADVRQGVSVMKYRKSEYERFKILASRNAVTPDVVDEFSEKYELAVAAWESAKIAVEKAQADWKEKKAKLDAARADVGLKEMLVEVARKDRDRAQALADFAKIRAPFNGVIVERRVDPGAFVQNATTAHAESFLTLVRTDLVTVYLKLPDIYADFVTVDTEAIIQLDKRPGELIQGKVTRFQPAIIGKDRIMRVEVDLFNGTEEEYKKFVARGVAIFMASLAANEPVSDFTLASAGGNVWRQEMKGNTPVFPLLPNIVDKSLKRRPSPLIPGMYGNMRLLLRKFGDSYLLPSGAVISRGGKRYILQVKNDAAVLTPVRVQVDDGNLSKVVVIEREANPKSGEQELYHDLTGEEEIILSSQGEIGQGQAVRTTFVDW
ncbi:MAG TPA: efflux RND transporter periplasmic adaptor subunit [Gemmataceae bacterium]|nr:efflux RND transporter periplasmic adaptor subunit [Gemmataceae bacterium]